MTNYISSLIAMKKLMMKKPSSPIHLKASKAIKTLPFASKPFYFRFGLHLAASNVGFRFVPGFSFHNTAMCSKLQHAYDSLHHKSRLEQISNKDDAYKVFDEMLSIKPLPSVFKFNQLLIAVTNMRLFSVTLELFKQMCAAGIPSDVYTMNVVIRACCELRRVDEALAVMSWYIKKGVLPNAFTLNPLLNGLILEDRDDEAIKLFRDVLTKKHIKADVVTFNTMIKGCCVTGQSELALHFLKHMGAAGCKPNLVSYCTIINNLCKDRRVEDAFHLFNEMVSKRIQPNVVVYTCLIEGLCWVGRMDEAVDLVKEMEVNGFPLNVHTYSVLVNGFCKEARVKEAETVVKKMVDRGIVPNAVTYTSLIDGYCLRRQMVEAKRVFDLMQKQNVAPSVVTYNALINGYCKKADFEEAHLLLDEILAKGLKPTVVTYSTIIQGLFKVQRWQEALKLFDNMRTQGLEPDFFTYGIIVTGLCRNRQLEDAVCFLQTVTVTNQRTLLSMCTSVIKAADERGKIDIARSCFEQLSLKGLQPDSKMYTAMIAALCRAGLPIEAKNIFLKMNETGCPRDNYIYCVLLQGYIQSERYDDAEELMKEMRRIGYILYPACFEQLFALEASGALDPDFVKFLKEDAESSEASDPTFAKLMEELCPSD